MLPCDQCCLRIDSKIHYLGLLVQFWTLTPAALAGGPGVGGGDRLCLFCGFRRPFYIPQVILSILNAHKWAGGGWG